MTLAPWTTRIAAAAAPAMTASRRATCTALAEVIADHPAATSDITGAVQSFVQSWNEAPVRDRDTMLQCVDAVEVSVSRSGFAGASKKARAAALQASIDEIYSGEPLKGSQAYMIDTGLSGLARFMVRDYCPRTPRPIPVY